MGKRKRPRFGSSPAECGGKRPRFGSSPAECGGKRPRFGSSPAELSAPRKVGIVCHSMSGEVGKKGARYEVKLYVVDVDQESLPNILATPAVRIIFRRARKCTHAVCVLNSTLYMFWGYNPDFLGDFRRKCGRKFSLSNGTVNLEVKKRQLDRIAHMNFPKAFPVALPTPKGNKILVFSGHIVLKDTSGDFELYNTKSCTWETLPGLPSDSFLNCCSGRYPCKCFSSIRCYSFAAEFHFYVEYGAGSFLLDIEEKTWKSLGIMNVTVPAKRSVSHFVFTTKTRPQYALTAEGKVYPLWNRKKSNKLFYSDSVFPLSKFPAPNIPKYLQHFNLPSMLLLGEDEQVCETAILQIETARRSEGSNARLLLDVFRTELKDPFTSTTVSNTVSLQIDFLEYLYNTVLISL